MMLIGILILVWLAVLVAVLGACGLAGEADARDQRLAAGARGDASREPRCGARARRLPSRARHALR